MQERTERKAVLTGMTFAIVVGFAFLANKAALTGGGLYDVLTYRFLFALLVLPVVLKISKLSLRIAKKDIPAMLILCATYLLFLHFQLIGLLTCSTVVGAVFFATAPVFIAVFAVPLLGEHLDKVQIACILAGALAVILMIMKGEGAREMTAAGAMWLALSTLLSATHSTLTRYHRGKFQPLVITGWIIVIGTVYFSVLLLIDHCSAGNMSGFFAPLADPAFLLSSVYLGIGCILVSSATINYTFRILPAAKAGIFNNISTVISILAGGLILREPLTIVHIVCAAVVITAAIIINGRKDQLT